MPDVAELTISAKNLGRLAGDFCPRCEWTRLRMGSKLPFQTFPGIFSSIDSFTKKVVEGEHSECGRLPVCLSEMLPPYDRLRITPSPHWSRFRRLDEASGMTLQGSPDLMFEFMSEDDPVWRAVIGDYKTARLTKAADALEAVYRVQLNSYRWIGVPEWTVAERLLLIYYEPVTELGAGEDRIELIEASTPRGMHLRFRPKWKDVPIDEPEVLACLGRARTLLDTDPAPNGKPGCKDCGNVDALVALVGRAHRCADGLEAAKEGDVPF